MMFGWSGRMAARSPEKPEGLKLQFVTRRSLMPSAANTSLIPFRMAWLNGTESQSMYTPVRCFAQIACCWAWVTFRFVYQTGLSACSVPSESDVLGMLEMGGMALLGLRSAAS